MSRGPIKKNRKSYKAVTVSIIMLWPFKKDKEKVGKLEQEMRREGISWNDWQDYVDSTGIIGNKSQFHSLPQEIEECDGLKKMLVEAIQQARKERAYQDKRIRRKVVLYALLLRTARYFDSTADIPA